MSATTRREFVKAAAALAPLATRPAYATRLAQASGDSFDYVIAGAGHNSLLCAAYLAKAGGSVLVLEGRTMIGGGVKTAEVLLPGFKEDLCSTVHGGINGNPALVNREIDVFDYGYEIMDPEIVVHIPFASGACFTVFREDPARTAATIARVSKEDAATFERLAASRGRVEAMPERERNESREGLYWQRLARLSGYDAARYLWRSPEMRAANLTAGHFGGMPGSDAGTGLQAISMIGHLDGRPIPIGGSGQLSIALGRYIEAHDGVILTNKPVDGLVLERGRCVGVECRDGSRYRARKGVVSTLHIKHLVEMAPRDLWGETLLDAVDVWQPEHAMFGFHFALAEPPRYASAEGGTIEPCEAAIMEHAESIFQLNEDQARGELNVDDYPLQIVHPQNVDATRGPPGYGAVKIEGTMPYALAQGPEHWDAIKEQIAERLFERYTRLTVNLSKDKVLAKVLMSPLDIERMNPSMWRGSVHHSVRSLGNFVPHRLPIPGLYQTGGCTAPGGSVTGRPGRATAAAVLEDDGKSLQEVAASRGRRA